MKENLLDWRESILQIIALGHKREVGKDLAGTLLLKNLITIKPESTIKKIGFADPIYEIAYKMYAWAGMRDKEYYNEHKEEKEKMILKINVTPREVLIDIGMKFREIYPETWLEYALSWQVDILIITDLRFPNEALRIRSMGGHTINVIRDVPQVSNLDDPDNQLNNWEWGGLLSNLGSKKDLNKSVLELIDAFIN